MKKLTDLRVGLCFRFMHESMLYEVKYISALGTIEYYPVNDSGRSKFINVDNDLVDIYIYKEVK
jgi:hypothetical protein